MVPARFPVRGRRTAQSTCARVERIEEFLERSGQTIEDERHVYVDRSNPRRLRETLAENYSASGPSASKTASRSVSSGTSPGRVSLAFARTRAT